ncbi:MAG: M24 family metallopeptidase [Bosea sp. (in: a-proteobacteria)]|nr:M24 family metallopeptidase [Bosea sp. (in: a-proteobacteria)]
MVLIDMGTKVGGYRSDITRTYVFGDPTARRMRGDNRRSSATTMVARACAAGPQRTSMKCSR